MSIFYKKRNVTDCLQSGLNHSIYLVQFSLMFSSIKIFIVLLLVFIGSTIIDINALQAKEMSTDGPELKIFYEGYEPTELEAKKITSAVNFLYFFYQKQLQVTLPKNLKVKLRVFGDYYSYKIYQMGFSKSTTDGAFYSSKFHEAVVWKRKSAALLFKDICHEVSHLLVSNLLDKRQKYFKKRPLWINEGLSEYFENLVLEGDNIEVQPNLVKLERCRDWLANNQLISLEQYFAFTNKEWKKNDIKGKKYQSRTLGWSIIYFLFSKSEGTTIIGNMLNSMVNNQSSVNHSFNAVIKSYPGGIVALERDWKFWLLQNNQLAVHKIKSENTFSPNLTQDYKTEGQE